MKGRISRNPQIRAGEYCIRGTRIPVWTIQKAAKDWSHETILKEWPDLTQADIDAALAFRSRASCDSGRLPQGHDREDGHGAKQARAAAPQAPHRPNSSASHQRRGT